MAERLIGVTEKLFRTLPLLLSTVDAQVDNSPWKRVPLPDMDVPSFKMPKPRSWWWWPMRVDDADKKRRYNSNDDHDHKLLQLEPKQEWNEETHEITLHPVDNTWRPQPAHEWIPQHAYEARLKEEVFAVTVLDLVIVRGQDDLARRLAVLSRCLRNRAATLFAPARTNATSVLHLAARAGLAATVEALLLRGISCDDQSPRMDDYRPLQCAAVLEGNRTAIRLLVACSAELRYRRRLALPNPGTTTTTNEAQYQRSHMHDSESDHRNTSPLVLAMQQRCLRNACQLLFCEVTELRLLYSFNPDLAEYQVKRRLQHVLLKCVKTDELLDLASCILRYYKYPPKNLCLHALRWAEAMTRSNSLYADPTTVPNRQTVTMLLQKHRLYRGISIN